MHRILNLFLIYASYEVSDPNYYYFN